MDRQFFILALAAALSVLLVIAAATDIRSRIISNRLNIAIAALAPLFWLANGLAPWPDMLLQIIFACIIFRSEEHTSELQSLMRISYAVFCLNKKKKRKLQTIKHVKIKQTQK